MGDLFLSSAQTLVNTVNCVGVMGKGVALGFRQRFPDMYREYAQMCERGEVKLGRPYLWRSVVAPWVLNFPTKNHWRENSSLSAIVAGLEYLEEHYKAWGIESLAVPPLGSGLGGLDWRVVGPTLYQHLSRLDIPVELYAPIDTPEDQLTLDFLMRMPTEDKGRPRLSAGAVAIATIVQRLHEQPYAPTVGRVAVQKIAYFLTQAGVPTGLNHIQGSFGPYSPEFADLRRRMINHGVIEERRLGSMNAAAPGRTLADAQQVHASELVAWADAIDRVVDLFTRLRTARQAEVAATVHFAAKELRNRHGAEPSEYEVLEFVRQWKERRDPPLTDTELALGIRALNALGWMSIPSSESLPVPP
ncbi:MAG TPA: macro domain-containing protein [Candidatus Limnocylindrales bacterium]|nr:macro domain-containing protein [Candidatus Limnocylindrales bacterium]